MGKRGQERKGKKGKWGENEGKFRKMSRGLFFFFFLVTFWKHWNLFRVYQNGQILPGKIIFHAGKNHISRWEKTGKLPLPPLKDIPVMPLTPIHVDRCGPGCYQERIQDFLKEGAGAPKLMTDRSLAPVGTRGVWGGCAPSEAEKNCNFQIQFAQFGAFFLHGAPTQSQAPYLCKK